MYSTLITSGCFTVKPCQANPLDLAGHSYLWGRADLGTTFVSLKSVYLYASDTSRNPLQSCLVFHSILDLLLKISFLANLYSSYYIILSSLVNNSIVQRNMNRRGEKRVGAVREKSPSPIKITRERISNIGEQIMVIYIWKIDGKGYIYLEYQAFSTLNLRQWFRLRAISHLYWCSNSDVLVDVWLSLKIHRRILNGI